ncbi:MAG: LCP family protein [Treponema sp.]|nr:LCP family protein [Treponema sp.]
MKRGVKLSDPSLLLLLAILGILAAGGFLLFRVLRTDPIVEALEKKQVINVLFILEGDGKPLGSYVLMYSPGNNRASAISIPGDVGKIIRSTDRVDRIDSAYNPKNNDEFISEVESLLDLGIDYSVVFEWEKLGKIVDLIEGVELFVPHALEIYGDVPILFPSGNMLLDGDKARQYIRFELAGEEPEQMSLRREQFFIGFLKSLGEKHGRFDNPQMASAFYPLFKTEMNRLARERFFEALSVLDISRVSIQPVAGNYREVSGQDLLIPHYDGTVIKDIVRQAQRSLSRESPGALVERVFTVEVLNGTGTTGLASRTADLIRGFRYDVVSTGNADRGDYEKTEVIDRTGLPEVLTVFADTINCKNIRYESRISGADEAPAVQNLDYKADFTLIIGKDFNGRVVTGN